MIEAITARLPRVLRVEGPVHAEIAADPGGTGQAVAITALASAIAAITSNDRAIAGIVTAIILAPIGLFLWSGISFVVGKLFGGTASYIALTRPIGYSAAPFALGIIPGIGALAGTIYSAIIQVKLHQEVNGLSQGAAVAVVLIPLVILFGLLILLAVVASVALFGALNN